MGKSRGCIIRKNTKELRESLMSLRYRWLVKEKGANCIVTNPEILKYMELQEKSARAMIIERIEKYEKREPYNRNELNN